MKELEKIEGPKEHPALAEKRARGEVAKLDLGEYESKKKLEEDPAREWQRVRRRQKIFRGRIKRRDRGEWVERGDREIDR